MTFICPYRLTGYNDPLSLEEFEDYYSEHSYMVSTEGRRGRLLLFRGRSLLMCTVKTVGCSEGGGGSSGASPRQGAETASVAMLLLLFGQQIFLPVLPIFIRFGLVLKSMCRYALVHTVQLPIPSTRASCLGFLRAIFLL